MMVNTTKLPAPVAEIWEWQIHGNCRHLDSELFFHPQGERGAARAGRIAAAKRICGSCPVITHCRQHALTAEEPFGVWGGLDEAERRQVLANKRHVTASG